MGADDNGPLASVLLRHGAQRPTEPAFVYLDGQLRETAQVTRHELHCSVSALAAQLSTACPGARRAVLGFRPGLSFIAALLACMWTGIVAVPAPAPRGKRSRARFEQIMTDSAPDLVLADPQTARDLARTDMVAPVVVLRHDPDGRDHASIAPATGEIAMVQYTSGSVNTPKGVVLTSSNLLANLDAMADSMCMSADDVVLSWLPPQHDLGLIAGILLPLHLGSRGYLMSPLTFAEEPMRWLTAISRYGVTASGGPDSAYELCVREAAQGIAPDLWLGSLRIALNGSEPVRARTIRRFTQTFGRYGFAADAMRPCYGLAEATLFVTAARPGTAVRVKQCASDVLGQAVARQPVPGERVAEVVSCGQPPAGTMIEITDPVTGSTNPNGTVGEIVVRGPGVAAGYWGACAFDPDDPTRLRTGDLGFLEDGELYVIGRASDMIIVRGRNIYPSDVELAAGSAHPMLDPACVATIADDNVSGAGFAVIAEYRGRACDVHAEDFAEIRRAVVTAVAEALDLAPTRVVMVAAARLPRTTSGKIRRQEIRRALRAAELPVLFDWVANLDPWHPLALPAPRDPGTSARVQALLAYTLGDPIDGDDWNRPIHLLGIDSMRAAQLVAAARLEFEITLTTRQVLDHVSAADILALAERAVLDGRGRQRSGNGQFDVDVETLVGILEARNGRDASRK